MEKRPDYPDYPYFQVNKNIQSSLPIPNRPSLFCLSFCLRSLNSVPARRGLADRRGGSDTSAAVVSVLADFPFSVEEAMLMFKGEHIKVLISCTEETHIF